MMKSQALEYLENINIEKMLDVIRTQMNLNDGSYYGEDCAELLEWIAEQLTDEPEVFVDD